MSFLNKYKTNETIGRYKVRLAEKDLTLTYMIDYEETFALLVKMNTIQILLSLAAHFD